MGAEPSIPAKYCPVSIRPTHSALHPPSSTKNAITGMIMDSPVHSAPEDANGARIFTAMFVTVADMVVYSEDPMAHSRTEANVPGGCNAVTFVARCEPPSCPTPNTH